MKNALRTGLMLCLVVFAISCTNPPTPTDSPETNSTEAQTQTNSATVSEIERVVALSTLSADLTQQLAPEKLVGVPGSRLLQQDARFEKLPTVSEGRTPPNLEQVVALEPDLVLGASGFHDNVIQQLQEIGIATQLIEVNSWSTLSQITADLAERLAANPQPLLQRYQSCLDQAPSQGQSVLVLVSRQPILSPNKNSWTGDFLQQFQAKNLAADLQGDSPVGGYVTLSAEKVLSENPDKIIVVDAGNQGILEQFQKDVFWGKLTATINADVHTLDYYGFVNPGSIEKIEQTCDHLSQILAN